MGGVAAGELAQERAERAVAAGLPSAADCAQYRQSYSAQTAVADRRRHGVNKGVML